MCFARGREYTLILFDFVSQQFPIPKYTINKEPANYFQRARKMHCDL